MEAEKKKYIDLMLNEPSKIGHWLGFTKLNDLNNEWMVSFLKNKEDQTLQAHRGSYKTTCLSIFIADHIVIFPNKNIIFLRKTDNDVIEIINQVKKILESETFQYLTFKIYGKSVKMIKSNSNEITTNLVSYSRGSTQLLGMGIKGSLTGKHGDLIITDDIVNLRDRISRAEREYTKQIYQELQNIKNRGGRIINTGTPWHKDDCFALMPNISKYDCHSTGLMTREEVETVRGSITPSLFAANYELQHIASENALFTTSPKFTSDMSLIYDGIAHVDAAYGGEDGSAMTLFKKTGETVYVLGKIRKMHIDNCLDEYLLIKNKYRCGSVSVENNADKGYLAKEIRGRKETAIGYHESMNKYIKISTYLKKYWNQLIFLDDTDPEYINEIMDYTEDADHDDCPDSLATLLRKTYSQPRESLIKQLQRR